VERKSLQRTDRKLEANVPVVSGLEADQKVIAAHGCYAMTATTALTAQNTQGVYGIHEIPSDFVRKQIDVCVEDIGVDVVKTGILQSKRAVLIHTFAKSCQECWLPRRQSLSLRMQSKDTISSSSLWIRYPYMPHCIQSTANHLEVMVSTSGAQLLPEEAVRTLLGKLLPITTILTPNFAEGKLLLKEANVPFKEPETPEDLVEMAEALQRLGPKYVLLKGGHMPLTKDRKISVNRAEFHIVFNVLAGPDGVEIFETEYFQSKNTHGTGCSLACTFPLESVLCHSLMTLASRNSIERRQRNDGFRSSPVRKPIR
jgi:hydroxymethylpyrimidine/phosphomethylpyrimidine kinase